MEKHFTESDLNEVFKAYEMLCEMSWPERDIVWSLENLARTLCIIGRVMMGIKSFLE